MAGWIRGTSLDPMVRYMAKNDPSHVPAAVDTRTPEQRKADTQAAIDRADTRAQVLDALRAIKALVSRKAYRQIADDLAGQSYTPEQRLVRAQELLERARGGNSAP